MDLMRSLPLGLYLEQPITWLHGLDARIKLTWLLTFLLTPLLANPLWRVVLVVALIVLTLSTRLPWRVWKQQMGWLLALCLMVFALSTVLPDGLQSRHQPRLPANSLEFAQTPLPQLPADKPWWDVSQYNPFKGDAAKVGQARPVATVSGYRYILFHQGPFTITRRSLDVAIRFSSLLFTLIYSTTLFLLTTAPEEITATIESALEPLRRFGVPVTEIALTLTLALRFMPLVLEEVQNLTRSVVTRAINWQKLGWRGSVQVWLVVAEKLLENLLLRAEQMSSAMVVRGFTTPKRHQVQWHSFRWHNRDWLALVGLVLFWLARLRWGQDMS
jgi:energy-coupling factor transport system permease protein